MLALSARALAGIAFQAIRAHSNAAHVPRHFCTADRNSSLDVARCSYQAHLRQYKVDKAQSSRAF